MGCLSWLRDGLFENQLGDIIRFSLLIINEKQLMDCVILQKDNSFILILYSDFLEF